jgi:hypothetical protein
MTSMLRSVPKAPRAGEQWNDPASQPAAHGGDWKAAAVAAYYQGRTQASDDLRRLLAVRLFDLTGQRVPPEAIYVTPSGRAASVMLDGAVFRAGAAGVVLLRSCAFCGSGSFESAPLHTRADLGHALTAWEPAHPACGPDDPPGWLEI